VLPAPAYSNAKQERQPMSIYLTQEHLKKLLHYDSDTGEWTWLRRNGTKRPQAGNISNQGRSAGYRRICVDGKSYYSSHLVFLYMTGEFPNGEVDHIDRNRSNDKWSNLRITTHTKNCQNRGIRNDNTSGYPGVSFNTQSNRWKADICVDGVRIYLGKFIFLEDAIEARKFAEKTYLWY